MNYLAHLLTAGDDPLLRYGVLLGDHVRGQQRLTAWPPAVRSGVRLHRAVDSFTDSHQATAAARAMFAPPFRRYAGIMIDIYFDHLLSRHWDRFGPTGLAVFAEQTLALMAAYRHLSPTSLRRFEDYARATRILERYNETAALQQALAGVGSRLRRANPLHRAASVLQARDTALETTFLHLFPDVLAFASGWLECPATARPGQPSIPPRRVPRRR